jgi:hypothetical protein
VTKKQKFLKIVRALRKLPLRTKVFGGVGLFVLISYGLIFGLPKQVTFDYSAQVCVRQLTILPQVMKQGSDAGFKASAGDMVEVMGYPIASLKTCFTASKPPTEGAHKVTVSPFGSIVAAKQYSLNVAKMRTVSTIDFIGKTLPTTRPLELKLDGRDAVFTYKFTVGEKSVGCEPKDTAIHCDIEQLDLKQGKGYTGAITRYFGDEKIADIASGDFMTLMPLVLKGETVSDDETIYNKPAGLSFKYDKTLDFAEAELKMKDGKELKPVAVTVSTEGKTVHITPTDPLKRNAQFELIIKKVEAVDGSATPEEYKVNFIVSGGPKVTGISVGSISAPQSGSITISLDQEVANTDKIASLVTVQGVSASVAKSGKNLVISYNGAPKCGDIKITVKKGLESEHGIVQSADWSFTTRTVCHSIYTFGYSVQGRALNAWIFGSGSKTILYTGAIHGNEQSTRLLMNAWINELEVNARSIPGGVRIVVVPVVNPDGIAANTRANSRNVDLNRNFDVSDWKEDVVTPTNQPWPGGGGSAPHSEAETKAIANYTASLQPYLTMSYHSVGSYAIGNGCGNSGSLAATYANLTGYSNMTGVGGAFGYEITGTYDDWICEKLGRQSVLIELGSHYYSEFSRNYSALWAMARS